jgi:two-component system, sensor histidine kinase
MTPPPDIGLDAAQVGDVFPFHFAFDRDLQVLAVGRSLGRMLPSFRVGQPLADTLLLYRPSLPLEPGRIPSLHGQPVIFRTVASKDWLRGQLLPLADGSGWIFLGSPWFTQPSDLQRNGLEVGDFAAHDTVADVLQILQAQQMAFDDMKAIMQKLSQQRAESRRLSARLSALIGNLRGGVLVEDPERRILIVNQAFCTLFGIPADPAELVGLDCSNSAEQSKHLFAEPEAFVTGIRLALENRRTLTGEILTLRSGHILERDYVPIFSEGSYQGHLWHYRDITDRITAERALRLETSRLSLTLANIVDGVITTDSSGAITLLNSAALRILGTAESEVLGLPLGEVFRLRLSDPSVDVDPVAQVLGSGVAWETGSSRKEWRWLDTVDGRQLRVVASIAPIRGSVDDAGLILVFRDVSKEFEVEELKRDFVSAVSHELRTPITSMKGFLDTVLGDPEMPVEVRTEFLGVVRSQLKRLAGMVEKILQFSRLEAGQKMELAAFDLTALAGEIVAELSPISASRSVAIDWDGPSLPVEVLADREQIRSVLVNLLTNAIKFTPDGGRVGIGVHAAEGETVVAVRDTGIGIRAEDLPNLFQRFYRAPSSGQHAPGTGLGLSIVKEIVQRHGGQIHVDSRPGEGSTFTVRLPTRPSA